MYVGLQRAIWVRFPPQTILLLFGRPNCNAIAKERVVFLPSEPLYQAVGNRYVKRLVSCNWEKNHTRTPWVHAERPPHPGDVPD